MRHSIWSCVCVMVRRAKAMADAGCACAAIYLLIDMYIQVERERAVLLTGPAAVGVFTPGVLARSGGKSEFWPRLTSPSRLSKPRGYILLASW